MASKRPSAADYLGFLRSSAPAAQAKPKTARAKRARAVTPAPEAGAESAGEGAPEKRGGERVSFYLAPEVVAELRGAADALSGPPHFANVSAVTESALRRELERLRKLYNAGKPFPSAGARDRRRRARLD